jgi:hypothetical protein
MIPLTLRHNKRRSIPATPPAGWTNGYSIDLDGVDEYAVRDSYSLSGDTSSGGRTIAFWMKTGSIGASDRKRIVQVQDQSTSTYNGFWSVRLHGTSGPTVKMRMQRRVENGSTFSPATNIDSSFTFAANTWYLVGISTNGSGIKLYQNSTIDSRNSSSSGDWWGDCGWITGAVNYHIGSTKAGSQYHDGMFSESYYFDKELSTSEWNSLYNSGTPVDPDSLSFSGNLVQYHRYGDGDTYPTLTENKGTGDDLTMTNMESGDIVTDVP